MRESRKKTGALPPRCGRNHCCRTFKAKSAMELGAGSRAVEVGNIHCTQESSSSFQFCTGSSFTSFVIRFLLTAPHPPLPAPLLTMIFKAEHLQSGREKGGKTQTLFLGQWWLMTANRTHSHWLKCSYSSNQLSGGICEVQKEGDGTGTSFRDSEPLD